MHEYSSLHIFNIQRAFVDSYLVFTFTVRFTVTKSNLKSAKFSDKCDKNMYTRVCSDYLGVSTITNSFLE